MILLIAQCILLVIQIALAVFTNQCRIAAERSARQSEHFAKRANSAEFYARQQTKK